MFRVFTTHEIYATVSKRIPFSILKFERIFRSRNITMRKEFIESTENVKFDEKSHAFKWITPRKISFLRGGKGIDTDLKYYL